MERLEEAEGRAEGGEEGTKVHWGTTLFERLVVAPDRGVRGRAGAGIGERGVELAVPNAAEDGAEIVRDGPRRRPTPASQTGDGQARRRALKRYKADENG